MGVDQSGPHPLLSGFGLARCTVATETAAPIAVADHNFMPPFDADKGFEPGLVRAIDHPVRAQFLKLFAERETVSPAEALPLLEFRNLALSNVTYHARVLDQCELVEATEDPGPNGGATFRVTPKGEDALVVLGVPPREENGS
ncbi:MAG TPA: helix-turn-helix domain-containing protein [Solirubrobacterales bacterium]